MKPYQYQPLERNSQEIRLVHLLPGSFEQDITFAIVHTPLFPVSPSPPSQTHRFPIDEYRSSIPFPWTIEELESGEIVAFNVAHGQTQTIEAAPAQPQETSVYEPEFEALSYTWGDAFISELGFVKDLTDNGSSPASLGLRPNLTVALRHLRYPDRIRILWIDAICINQGDVDERNVQVKRMTEIYSLASRVVAWLGVEQDGSRHAFTTLRHIGQQLESTKSGRLIAAPHATEPRMWRNDHKPIFDQDTWKSIMQLVERDWFYRVWCWQEIRLGSNNALLQCSHDTVAWKKFWLAILCLHNKNWLPSMWFRERCRHIVFLQHDTRSHPLSNILDVCRSKGCTDPRDKIYGLLGMTPPSFTGKTRVDYSQPVEEVYKSAFLLHSQVTKRLELLKHCKSEDRKISGPSWVPDWSHTDFAAPLLSEQLSAGMSRAWFTYIEPDRLKVIGKRHSAIQILGDAASKVETETLLAVKNWMQCLPTDIYYVTGERMDVAFALTLCMNRSKERHPYIHNPLASEWVTKLRQILALGSDSADTTIYTSRDIAGTVQKLRGRRFFVTDTGHIGTAPAGARAGDLICIILGTYAPFVLRKTRKGEFLVVGECYVHGLSDGVGILGPLPDGWNVIIKGDASGFQTQVFTSINDTREALDDPRLPPLPDPWESVVSKRTVDDPSLFESFRNFKTGTLLNSDPRWDPVMLESCGITLESLTLV